MVLADDGRLSFESHQDLSGYELLRTPIWIFEVDRHQMWWGNRGALEFWGAKSIADLQARDYSSDSRIVRDRLRQIVMAEKPDLRIEESWTLFPLGKPTTVTAKILPVRIEDGRRGVLVEATGLIDLSNDPGALRILEAARISPLLISTFSHDGRLLAQNPAASDCYGIERLGDESDAATIFQRYSQNGVADRLLRAIKEDTSFQTETPVTTSRGERWHRAFASRGRDPMTGQFVLVVTEDDITAGREAERSAQESRAEMERRIKEDARLSNARLMAAIEAIPDGFGLFDADDRLVLCNQRYREVYPKHGDALVIGERFEDMLRIGVSRGEFADAIGREEEWIAERLRLHANPQGPIEQRLSDGRWLRAEERRTRDGETVGLRIDITEQKLAEKDLRDSKERLVESQRIARIGTWEHDLTDNVLRWSDEIYRLLEIDRARFGASYKAFLDAIHPDDRKMVDKAYTDSLANRSPYEITHRVRMQDGRIKWVHERCETNFDADGKPLIAHGTIQDITDRKGQEETIRTRDAWLRAILENTPIEIVLKDTDGRIVAISRNVADIQGLERDDYIGRTTADFLPGHIAGIYMAADRKVVETGKPLQQEVVEEVDGIIRYSLNAIFPLRDDDGRITGVCSLTSDITEMKQAEERLRQAQKMEAIGQLTGGIAHDFNNLLAVIQGNLELIEEQLQDPEQKAMIGAALRSAARGARLTGQLLVFGRKALLKPEAIDLNHHFEAMGEMIHRIIPAKIMIETTLAEGLWPVELDQPQLEAAALNIVINATDAMPRGGRLTIATANAVLTEDDLARFADGLVPGRYVTITLSDTGHGMDAETVARAFDPFFTTKPVGLGTGLGLSMVHGFVRQSGGDVLIESEPGQGTTVRLYFPARQRPAEAASPARDETLPRSARGESVLVVEDQADVRRVVTAQLRSPGYDVIEAEDGPSALAVLKSDRRIDLMLTDMVMPGRPQGPVLGERARILRPGIRVIFMTGYPIAAPDRGVGIGPGDVHLAKPISKGDSARSIWKQFNDNPAE